MEVLMINLQEQQHHLQLQQYQSRINDLANMEILDDREPTLPHRQKYVSIFRIDGAPILPPLMTSEKRKQMQKIKEKALKVEQRLRQRKQQINKENDTNTEDIVSETSRSGACITAGNTSQTSQDYYDSNFKESEASIMLLQNLIKIQHQGDKDYPIEKLDGGGNATVNLEENQEKLLKLQKSEILIYDNSTKEVIQLPPENRSRTLEDGIMLLRDTELKTNSNYLQPKKPSQLLLAGVDGKGITSIPSICLNPPTPLTANMSICDNLGLSVSNESFTISKDPMKSHNLTEDISSEDSFNSMLTHSDGSSSRNLQNKKKHTKVLKGESGLVAQAKKPYKKLINVSSNIQQSDVLSSDNNTPQTTPKKSYQPRKPCLETSTVAMSRSATSPSIKLSASSRSLSSRSHSLALESDNSPENALVRSSSFTLDGPSKALIDHMRLQKSINEASTNVNSPLNTTRTITRKSMASPLRAHRDTVESKAKRVQKVELKSSKQKLQQKTSQSKLAQAAVASFSPYNSTTITHQNNNVYKMKKSPYGTIKPSHSAQTLHKSTASSSHMRKSASTALNIMPAKTSKSQISCSPMQTPSASTPNTKKSPTGKEAFSQMDKTQKEKFLRLLALQEEESRKLQQSFEMQQKMLIEQLNKEMSTTHIKSPTNSINSSSTSLSHKSVQHDKHSQLSSQLQAQLNLSKFSSDTKSVKPIESSDLAQHHSLQQQSPTMSINSSYISSTNTQSQFTTTTTAQQSSFSLHYTQTPTQPNHSNANTSLDISTISNQTSPDTLSATTPINIQSSNNKSGNKSSSRRRLFTPDMSVGDAGTTKSISSRAITSSSYPSTHRMTEQAQHYQQPNKSSMGLTHNSSQRRHKDVPDTFVLHAAATKINACARGFLVRRLFQTEQIQRIVQTIRDTLIFVLNLHIETMENAEESNTPANIKLKVRLLQQLSSACRTLHLLFFQTSIKERMEIIARDRKRIKSKLLSMNRKRTPRIAG